jgi:transposase
MDEFGQSFIEAPAPTWAPRGHTPVLKRVGKYRRESSTMAGVSVSGKLFKRHFKKSIKSKDIVTGLKQLDRQLPGRKIVVWDQSRTHRAKLVKTYLAANDHILVETLPAYAPELNPEEYCHGHAKQRAKNHTATSVAAMRKFIDRDFAFLRRRPDLLLGFFHHAGLALKRLW